MFAIALGHPAAARAIALSSTFQDLGSVLTQAFNPFTRVLRNGQGSVQSSDTVWGWRNEYGQQAAPNRVCSRNSNPSESRARTCIGAHRRNALHRIDFLPAGCANSQAVAAAGTGAGFFFFLISFATARPPRLGCIDVAHGSVTKLVEAADLLRQRTQGVS